MKRVPKKYKIGDILYVVWHDAYTDNNGWQAETKLQNAEACRCYSVGRYSGRNKDGNLLLAGSWDTSPKDIYLNNVSGRPIEMVKEIKLIKKGKILK